MESCSESAACVCRLPAWEEKAWTLLHLLFVVERLLRFTFFPPWFALGECTSVLPALQHTGEGTGGFPIWLRKRIGRVLPCWIKKMPLHIRLYSTVAQQVS